MFDKELRMFGEGLKKVCEHWNIQAITCTKFSEQLCKYPNSKGGNFWLGNIISCPTSHKKKACLSIGSNPEVILQCIEIKNGFARD